MKMTKLDFENLLRRNHYKYYVLTKDDKEAGAGNGGKTLWIVIALVAIIALIAVLMLK